MSQLTGLGDHEAKGIARKGAHLYDAGDAREKRDIGRAWAAASAARCLFAMVTDPEKAGKSVAVQLREALRT